MVVMVGSVISRLLMLNAKGKRCRSPIGRRAPALAMASVGVRLTAQLGMGLPSNAISTTPVQRGFGLYQLKICRELVQVSTFALND